MPYIKVDDNTDKVVVQLERLIAVLERIDNTQLERLANGLEYIFGSEDNS